MPTAVNGKRGESEMTDEARWRSEGKSAGMTLEQRAEFIACATTATIGGSVWNKIRARALAQLREVSEGRA
jgi:hypothetical protein